MKKTITFLAAGIAGTVCAFADNPEPPAAHGYGDAVVNEVTDIRFISAVDSCMVNKIKWRNVATALAKITSEAAVVHNQRTFDRAIRRGDIGTAARVTRTYGGELRNRRNARNLEFDLTPPGKKLSKRCMRKAGYTRKRVKMEVAVRDSHRCDGVPKKDGQWWRCVTGTSANTP